MCVRVRVCLRALSRARVRMCLCVNAYVHVRVHVQGLYMHVRACERARLCEGVCVRACVRSDVCARACVRARLRWLLVRCTRWRLVHIRLLPPPCEQRGKRPDSRRRERCGAT